MVLKLKSQRKGNWIGIAMELPNGCFDMVESALMPNDKDWRSDIEFYDSLVKIYQRRWRKVNY